MQSSCAADVLGCNEVQSQIFYYDDDCNLVAVPGDNIIYATLSKYVSQ